MKFLELRLSAFGPFSDATLDLANDAPLQVIFGPNEAGKSTALRAIRGLLYGIPERTGDDHRHRAKDLRIGGVLGLSDGSQLEIVRRKGRSKTLLDAAGKPLDEELLRLALAGVGPSLFDTLFGLDHNSLRDGAKALLEGGGDVGESLFDAGGARGVHRVLERLRDESAAIYKPRGQKQKLNQALRQFKELKSAINIKQLGPQAWSDQRTRLAEAEAERDQQVQQRQQLDAERHRLSRARNVLPQLAERRELQQRLAPLAALPLLASDAASQRQEADRQAQQAERDVTRLRQELASLEQQHTAGHFNEALAAVDEGRIQHIQNALGNHRKAAADLPKRQGTLAAHEAEIAVILRQLPGEVTLAEVESLRVDAASASRLASLAKQHGVLQAERENLDRGRSRLAKKISSHEEQLAALAGQAPLETLREAIRRGETALDQQAAADRARLEQISLQEQQVQLLASLGLAGTPEVALRFTPPSSDTIARYADDFADLARRNVEARAAGTQLDEAMLNLEQALDVLTAQGELPSQQALEALRDERDRCWRELRDRWGSDSSTMDAEFQALENATSGADRLADQLWRDADRVAQQARLHADRSDLQRRRAQHDELLQGLPRSEHELRTRWQTEWLELAIEPRSPSDMRSWLQRHEQLLQTAAKLRQVDVQLAAAAQQDTRRRDALVEACHSAAQPSAADEAALPDRGASLEAWLNAGRERLRELETQQQRALQLSATLADARREQVQLDEERLGNQTALQQWQNEWRQRMQVLALSGDASVEEAEAVLHLLGELFKKVKDARDMQRRVDGIEADAATFRELVHDIVGKCLPDQLEQPLGDLAETLVQAHREALAKQRERKRLRVEIDTREQERGRVEELASQAQLRLADLMTQAGVEDLQALQRVEAQVLERDELRLRLKNVETSLLRLGDGRTLDELVALVRDIDVDTVESRLLTLSEQLEQLTQRIETLSVEIGNHQHTLEEHFNKREGAYASEADRQACLASIRAHTEDFVRLRLATSVLEQEIERYRQANQGPVLGRAAELFPRLTLDRYRELRVDYAGERGAELVCVRRNGDEVDVSGLSDGTRDQLYLALRLASLERYAERHPMVPLVLDDILIHFDDERAAAALEVLHGFSATTQVLFFTHHRRLLELARKVLPAGGLYEHRLDRATVLDEPSGTTETS